MEDCRVMSSLNKGHRNHPISFLCKEPINGWILYMLREINRLKLWFTATSSLGELYLLTTIPKQLTKDPIFWFRNLSCKHS